MVRLGGLLTVLGFGSVVLYSFGWQFRILVWAEPMQPWLGVVLGIAGVAVLAVKFLGNKDKTAAAEMPGGQQFAPPPGGFAPPPGVQRGQNFGQQQGFAPGGYPAPGPQPGMHIGAHPGVQGYQQPRPQGPEPVLGRPQFAPQITPPGGQQPPAPAGGVPQFPPRQQPPREQQPFGPQG